METLLGCGIDDQAAWVGKPTIEDHAAWAVEPTEAGSSPFDVFTLYFVYNIVK